MSRTRSFDFAQLKTAKDSRGSDHTLSPTAEAARQMFFSNQKLLVDLLSDPQVASAQLRWPRSDACSHL